uniref:Uncharacterized protein n=1 Tax=Heterorhabditis bacteriophora TaxID=37862 RepID=A0A1I7WY40_HETBA
MEYDVCIDLFFTSMSKRPYPLDVPNPYDESNEFVKVDKCKKENSQAIYSNQHHQRYIRRENTLVTYGKRIQQQSKSAYGWIRKGAQMSISYDQMQILRFTDSTENQKGDEQSLIETPTTVHVYGAAQNRCYSTPVQLKEPSPKNIVNQGVTKLGRITTFVAFSQYLSSTGHDVFYEI